MHGYSQIELINRTLKHYHVTKTDLAEYWGVSRSTVYRHINKPLRDCEIIRLEETIENIADRKQELKERRKQELKERKMWG